MNDDVSTIYRDRFANTGLAKRQRVWSVLCEDFFSKLIAPNSTVLDVACGYGEFSNNITAAHKFAVDLNPDSPKYLNPDVVFTRTAATDLSAIKSDSIDVAFTSNFLEHLKSKDECNAVFAEIRRVLKPGGRFIVLGPNIRYCYAQYWDYYDHYLPLSDLSLAEGLRIANYDVVRVIDRFLPYTMNNNTPTRDFLVRLYLKMPFAWRFLGKQFLVIAQKKAS
ncbi:MAG: methyltransferase domain-containing protein [Hyphomicrobiaceae bacterium]